MREFATLANPPRLDLLAGLVVSFLSDASSTLKPVTPTDQPPTHLAQADALLRAHLDRPLAISELAEALFISPGYLRQLFQRAYGHGPMHHLLDLRIEQAKQLLAAGNLPVAEVARHCGFASAFHFSRVFSRLAGQPPSRWRKFRETGT